MKAFVRSVLIGGAGALGLLYLVNPTAGILEFIPDAIPVLGNLDEGAATVLLVGALRYFGLDLSGVFARKKRPKDQPPPLP